VISKAKRVGIQFEAYHIIKP